ncbi:ATP-dependent DNA helicase DDX11-like [Haliotis rubra]|uniref:ATP-dependent DNA helicase DDX11-like n=1 Tax=Haliotis rubra TaxID=36100 RepID=UPI001EE5A1BB|nr:ATP-dependent DNA helicase DDX11-like [Haliotis rubra]
MDEFDDEGDELLSGYELGLDGQNCGNTNVTTTDEKNCSVPESFPFPFEPYDIQKGFMQELYRCLELGKVGIFESPTGTGKSLSVICGALKWLRDYQQKQQEELEKLMAEDTTSSTTQEKSASTAAPELDWVAEFAAKKDKEESLKQVKIEQEQAQKREARLKKLRTNLPHLAGKRKRDKLDDEFTELMRDASQELKEAFDAEISQVENDGCHGDEELVLADYHSDEEDKEKEADQDEEEEHVTKIYFCSRTHSQLSQFVREIIKSPYGENTRVTSLGSRQSLCVNESVRRLKSLSLMNDRCLELQKNKGKSKEPGAKKSKKADSAGCPFYKQSLIQDYTDRALLNIGDIEQLVKLGRDLKACPYFGTRFAVPSAEIVALPYNTLLHHSTREACGIKLAGNIVVIDEAHNLLETINNIYSTEVTGAQVLRAHSQLSQYEAKFRSRLKAKNLMYVKQLLYVLASLVKFLGGKLDTAADKQLLGAKETRLLTINDFLFQASLDNINLFKVLRYCRRSMISRKLNGFVEKYQIQEVAPAPCKTEKKTESGLSVFLKEINRKAEPVAETVVTDASSRCGDQPVLKSPLMHIEGFLEALTNADKDGRMVISVQTRLSQSYLKFLLLNPAVHFKSVVKEARAVVVAGGTMQPISEFKQQLFTAAGVQADRILEYSCGHVIPGCNILPMVVPSGPSDHILEFTYQNRDKPALLDELGRLVMNVCQVVPGGVVMFFPSYDYEKKVYNHWDSSGMLKKIAARKRIFREPKLASMVDSTLAEFGKCIKFSVTASAGVTGGILLCVVGGKMSEGINFSDDLGRCIVMVGMPYPNMYSPELREKMDYLNKNYPKTEDGRLPGQIHYENICMKAVNQSIGRAIRHRGDYASILLCDRRYGSPNVAGKLPSWISQHLNKMARFGPVMAAMSKFFTEKKKLNL